MAVHGEKTGRQRESPGDLLPQGRSLQPPRSVCGAHAAALWLHGAGEAPEGAWSDGQGGSVPHVWPPGRAVEAGRQLRPSLHMALWASSSRGGLRGSHSCGLASPGKELRADPREGHKAP